MHAAKQGTKRQSHESLSQVSRFQIIAPGWCGAQERRHLYDKMLH